MEELSPGFHGEGFATELSRCPLCCACMFVQNPSWAFLSTWAFFSSSLLRKNLPCAEPCCRFHWTHLPLQKGILEKQPLQLRNKFVSMGSVGNTRCCVSCVRSGLQRLCLEIAVVTERCSHKLCLLSWGVSSCWSSGLPFTYSSGLQLHWLERWFQSNFQVGTWVCSSLNLFFLVFWLGCKTSLFFKA